MWIYGGRATSAWRAVPIGVAGAFDPPNATPVLALEGAWPNPARRSLTIGLSLPDDAPARVELFDLAGRRIQTRGVGALGAGRHVIRMELAAGVPAGMYVIRLSRGRSRCVRRSW